MKLAASYRRTRWTLAVLLVALCLPGAVNAQQPPATLSLEEAIQLARRNNPTLQITRNESVDADWSVREAYGQLVPGASIGSSLQYQAPGTQRIGLFTSDEFGLGAKTGYLASSYSLGLTYRLGGETLMRPGQQKANRVATHARIDAADFDLVAQVTRQYLAVMRARDAVELARRELERAQDHLRLAEARVAIGAEIELSSKRAQVEVGRAEVEVLRAENTRQTETMRLMEQLGIEIDGDVALISEFDVFDPDWSVDDLVDLAMRQHPQLRSLRASERAGESGVRIARSQYLPTLSFSIGWSGYTRQATNDDFLIDQYRDQMASSLQSCQLSNEILGRLNPPMPASDCSQFQISPLDEQRILDNNRVFPFNFSREPLSAMVQISLPIFNGFTRERQVERARVEVENTRHRLRQEELRLKTEVATAFQNLRTAYRTVELEERNLELAGQQLELARERYRVGSATFLDLKDAETEMARADRAMLTAVYTFHEGLAALSAAVGQSYANIREERE